MPFTFIKYGNFSLFYIETEALNDMYAHISEEMCIVSNVYCKLGNNLIFLRIATSLVLAQETDIGIGYRINQGSVDINTNMIEIPAFRMSKPLSIYINTEYEQKPLNIKTQTTYTPNNYEISFAIFNNLEMLKDLSLITYISTNPLTIGAGFNIFYKKLSIDILYHYENDLSNYITLGLGWYP